MSLSSQSSPKELLFNQNRVEVVQLEHHEVEEGDHNGEAADAERDQDEGVLVQDERGRVVHEKEKVQVDGQLGEVLAEEGVGAHQLAKRDWFFATKHCHIVIDAE